MSLTRGQRASAAARPRGSRPGSRAALAAAAIVLAAAAGGSIAAFAQATGDAPAAPAAPTAPDAPAAPTPGPRDGKVLQEWRLRCQLAEPEREMCEMHQRIVDQNGNHVLLAVVGRLPNIDTPGLLILLPLGIALPPGAFLTIDQGEERRVPVQRCQRQGCQIELLLDNELLPLLKAGNQATVSFHVHDPEGGLRRLDAPISLLGFSAALAEVMQ